MKRIIQIILMVLGVLFLVQLTLMGWFYLADPLGLFGSEKAVVTEVVSEQKQAEVGEAVQAPEANSEGGSATAGPSQAQLEAASEAGVEIPSFTPEMISCFEAIFGKARVDEMKNGSVPTAIEVYQGRQCL